MRTDILSKENSSQCVYKTQLIKSSLQALQGNRGAKDNLYHAFSRAHSESISLLLPMDCFSPRP
jgi:hypothetical protein